MLPIFGNRRRAERVSTRFRWFQDRLFPDTQNRCYAARSQRGHYSLEILKSSYFAWEIASTPSIYGNFILLGDVEIDPANGHSAAGFILRYNNEENFYAFLASNRGLYRFDLLFNNHPMPLIEWTPLPERTAEEAGSPLRFRIISHGSNFSFYADDEWVGEIEDETLGEGSVGFAAQNFAEAEMASFRMKSFALESRPVVVEREYLRWAHFVPHYPSARLALAETLFAQGNFGAAAVQLRRSLKDREGTAREHFLAAECYLKLSVYDRAFSHIEKVLSREPFHKDALFEKANILYLRNEFLRSRNYIRESMAAGTLGPSPALWNLLGNAEYALGNWDKAAEAYGKAAEAQPDMPLFLKNQARSCELAGRREQSLAAYLSASRILFRDQAYDELSLILPRVRSLDPGNKDVRALEAKMLYHEGKREEAAAILRQLAGDGTSDSAVYYLLGLILLEKGEREEALDWFSKAAEREPQFPLYHFRLAECRHLLGRDASEELGKALALDPGEPWINNLAGLVALEAGDCEKAKKHLEAAHGKAPGEIDIVLNLSEAVSRSGAGDGAIALLEAHARAYGDDPRIANQKGNILVRGGDFAGAAGEYEKAIRLDPSNPVYKENCASAYLEVDMVHRAEELLAQLERETPSASVYNLLGNVAFLKGEYPRAEAAYAAGISMDPGNPDLRTNLAMLQLERGRYKEAKAVLLDALKDHPANERAKKLLLRARERLEDLLACSSCGREWRVPKDLPPQPSLVVKGELPREAPAGRCPRCGKLACIACASGHLVGSRFHCGDCGEPLKLSDDALRFLVSRYADLQAGAESAGAEGEPKGGSP